MVMVYVPLKHELFCWSMTHTQRGAHISKSLNAFSHHGRCCADIRLVDVS